MRVDFNKEDDIKNKEEIKLQPKDKFKLFFRKYWPIGIKVIELLFCAICMGFIYEPFESYGYSINTQYSRHSYHLHHVGIMYTAYTGYILINTLMLISRAIGDVIPYRTSALFSLIGALLFLVTGVLLIIERPIFKNYIFQQHLYRLTMITVSISFAFLNVIVFSIDAVFTCIKQQDF